jgi:hypothetical protein
VNDVRLGNSPTIHPQFLSDDLNDIAWQSHNALYEKSVRGWKTVCNDVSAVRARGRESGFIDIHHTLSRNRGLHCIRGYSVLLDCWIAPRQRDITQKAVAPRDRNKQ